MLRAIKSIKQPITANKDLDSLMETFRKMVNHCIRLGLKHDVTTLKKLSLLSYHELRNHGIMSSYKLNAISQACGRLSQMKHDIKKGKKVKSPFIRKPYLVNCYGFKINNSLISIPFKPRRPINILLNHHTVKIL